MQYRPAKISVMVPADGVELSYQGNEGWPIGDEWQGTVLCRHID